MRRPGILQRYFLPALFFFPLLHCASTHNTVRYFAAKAGKAAYRELSTEHYLYVDDNHVAEAERGERRVEFVLRSADKKTARLFVRLKLYPEDEVAEPEMTLRLQTGVLRPSAVVVRREKISEQVTILESGENLRTNPTIGNDIQAQSGYITFGKPTGAGSARRNWQILILEAELNADALAAISASTALSVSFNGNSVKATADFSQRQLGAWHRFSTGESDETARE